MAAAESGMPGGKPGQKDGKAILPRLKTELENGSGEAVTAARAAVLPP